MISKKSVKLDDLLKDGFSKKFATYYLDHLKAETQNPAYNQDYVKWAHESGFLAESAYAYNLKEDNVENYLSDYDYYKIWPLNNWSRIWVNDKLTLKLMLSDSELKGFMPKYYYYSFDKSLKPLSDTPYKGGNIFENFLKLLVQVGEFACKPCNGTASAGFVRLSYKEKEYFINEKATDEDGIISFIKENPNYIFTEYIRPSKEFAVYSSSIHTLRVVVLNESGDNPRIVGGYLRLPNKYSGETNYIVLDGSDNEKYNVFCDVDFETGEYGNAKLTYYDHITDTDIHPDTGVKIAGKIKEFEKLKSIIEFVALKFSNLEYLGFDIGITDNGFKCMEINTHSGIKYMQIFKPFNTDDSLAKYFSKK